MLIPCTVRKLLASLLCVSLSYSITYGQTPQKPPRSPPSAELLNELFLEFPTYPILVSTKPRFSRNATAEEISGNWQLLSLPPELQPTSTNPWPADCQYFSYRTNGELKSVSKLRSPCDFPTSEKLDEIVQTLPKTVSWCYDRGRANEVGLIVVTRSDVTNYVEVWNPNFVVRSFEFGTVEFRPGDLLLFLGNPKGGSDLWVRHLRRLSQDLTKRWKEDAR